MTDTVKLLGIIQGATITADARFCHILLKLRSRCAIWKYRACPLRGKVMLLQSIILPLLCYTASVTCFTASMLKIGDVIIRNYIGGVNRDRDSASPGRFFKDWMYSSVGKDELVLTPVKAFI